MSESAATTAPILKEWMTGTQVAEMLGVSRQHVNRMFNRGDFTSLRRLGERPILVVKAAEVEKLRATREDVEDDELTTAG